MLTTVEIELIGYVGKNPIFPKPNEYPNFVTFSTYCLVVYDCSKPNQETKIFLKN